MNIFINTVIISFLTTLFLVLTKKIHGKFSNDSVLGPQKFHTKATPRIGGIGIYISLLYGLIALDFLYEDHIFKLLFFSGVILVIGLIEDINKNTKPVFRFTLISLTTLIACLTTNIYIESTGIAFFDAALKSYPVIKIILTVVAIAGLTNSYNIIDGFNGLSSGVFILSLIFFFLLANELQDSQTAQICAILIAATLGFFTINVITGRIFLGDCGAYLIGFILSFISILIFNRNSDLSPWCSMMVCAYPVTETLFSIYRKHKRIGHHPGQPDKVHLHMLIHRRIIVSKLKIKNKVLRNSLTSSFLLSLHCLALFPAFIWPNNDAVLVISFLLFVSIYLTIYKRLSQFQWL